MPTYRQDALQAWYEAISNQLERPLTYAGMTKSHRLVYEPVQIMHALFDTTAARQGWSIRSRIMREYIEFFGPKTEQLDMLAQEGKAIFTSFTEKITDGRGTSRYTKTLAYADDRQRCSSSHLRP